ncbi:hypothetical protein K1719_003295 [Acacia pycnantha]|nr:hypothetical protein K1719_003295 [Acacia pycnantha]
MYKVTCSSGTNGDVPHQPCKGRSATVKIVDHCPACEGLLAVFDLSQEAFSIIADPDAGKVNIEYDVGIKAWKNAQDNTGLTPEDYASMRVYHSYIQLIQTNTSKKSDETHHLVLYNPSSLVDGNTKKKQRSIIKSFELANREGKTLVYRPAMLSIMVAIAEGN